MNERQAWFDKVTTVLSGWWKKRSATVLGALIWGGIIALILLALPLVIVRIWVGNISSYVSLNPFLMSALITGVLFISGVVYLAILQRPRRIRHIVRALTLFYIIYNLALFAATRNSSFFPDGSPAKGFVVEVDGIIRECPRIGVADSETGRLCQAITPEKQVFVKRLRGDRFRKVDPYRETWFGANGEPLLAYYKHENGVYDFFNAPFSHPELGVQLQLVSQSLRKGWQFDEQQRKIALHNAEEKRQREVEATAKRQVEEAEAEAKQRRMEEEAEAKRQRIEAELAAEQEKLNAFLRTLNTSALAMLRDAQGHSSNQYLVVAIAPSKQMFGELLQSQLLGALKSNQTRIVVDLFTNQFYEKGYFQQLEEGQLELAHATGLLNSNVNLLFARTSYECAYARTTSSGMMSCSASVSIRMFDGSGMLRARDTFTLKGIGGNKEAALRRAFEQAPSYLNKTLASAR